MRLLPAVLSLVFAGPAFAEVGAEFSFYGGAGLNGFGPVDVNDPGGAGSLSFGAVWTMPPSSGMRLTLWRGDDYGLGVGLSSAGVTADATTLGDNGLSALALEEGINVVTVNAYRRWNGSFAGLAPYVGAGLGLAIPQVQFDGGGAATSMRQLTGAAMQVMAGARLPLGGQVALFGEYQGSYSVNVADLASNGSLHAEVLTSGVNLGISLGF